MNTTSRTASAPSRAASVVEDSSESPITPATGGLGKLIYHLNKWLRPAHHLRNKYNAFRRLLADDAAALDILTELDSHLLGLPPADPWRIAACCHQLGRAVERMANQLIKMNPSAYQELLPCLSIHLNQVKTLLPSAGGNMSPPYILPLTEAADHPELTGGKAANLSHARRAGVATPDGLVITVSAFHRFIADNHLKDDFIRCFTQADTSNHETITRIAGELQELVIGAEIPPELTQLIRHAVTSRLGDNLLAVRSSALAEDGRVSFAGQYASELQVPPGEIIAAYRRVLAGKYCPRAISYRIRHGLSDNETAMAVLVLPMYQPTCAGIVYTHDPKRPGDDALSIYVVAGLGQGLADGSQTPVCLFLPRTDNEASVCPDTELLTGVQLQTLRQWALKLENYFGCPQDVEWLLADNRLLVVQSRPLQTGKDVWPEKEQPPIPDDLATILYDGLHSAAQGIGSGPVFMAPSGKSFRDIPKGSIVVTPTLRPTLSQFLDRVNGIIATSGSRASHLAAVARERAIPVIVGTEIHLTAGQEVTVDGYRGRIYSGISAQQTAGRKHPRLFPREKFAALASATCQLNLVDPDSPDFCLEKCASLHDFIRYIHEHGIREMFSLIGRKGRGMGRTRKIETDLPLVMYLLDLDAPAIPPGTNIREEEITSLPMRACWRGLCDPRIPWDQGQLHLDWQEFDQMSGGIFALDSRLLASFAVTASDYLHLNIRFGYHFSIIDTLCSESPGANYLNFRFKGGGAAEEQREFRLHFIEKVLTEFGFDTRIKGDMLNASLSRASNEETAQGLTRLGRLLAYTRLMDIRLQNMAEAAEEAANFTRWAA